MLADMPIQIEESERSKLGLISLPKALCGLLDSILFTQRKGKMFELQIPLAMEAR